MTKTERELVAMAEKRERLAKAMFGVWATSVQYRGEWPHPYQETSDHYRLMADAVISEISAMDKERG